jgi:SH3-like domain-containing protein
MPWKEQSIMEAREEFCRLARQDGRGWIVSATGR